MSLILANTEKAYQEFPEINKEDIEYLKEWMETRTHLAPLSELQLILFHYSCDCQLPKTKTTINKYFELRHTSDFFKNGDEELVTRTLRSVFVGFLPEKTPSGEVILVSKLLDSDHRNYNFNDHIKLIMMTVLFHSHINGPVKGMKVIADFGNAGLGHLFSIRVMTVKHILQFVQEAAPVKMTEIHIVNAVPVTKAIVAIMKPFIKTEILKMLQIHYNSFDSLYEHIPQKCLPDNYGGSLLSLEELNRKNREHLLENMDLFKWLNEQTFRKNINKED